MALENFLSGYFLTFVLDAPEKREIIRRQLVAGLRITEVSLSLYAVLALPVAIRYFVASMVRSPPGGRSWRTACPALTYGNVPDE